MGLQACWDDKILTVKLQGQCKIGSTEGQIAISNGWDKHQLMNGFNKNFGRKILLNFRYMTAQLRGKFDNRKIYEILRTKQIDEITRERRTLHAGEKRIELML